MKTYRYTDETNTVAFIFEEDGTCRMSMLASAIELPEGAVIEPYVPPPPPIPTTVTRFQALAVLAQADYLDTIWTYIDSLPRSDITRLAFENATEWERTSPTLATLATMLNLTSEQVDDLFIAASNISA
jgi:hypothetical protein